MAYITKCLYNLLSEAFEEHKDPRVDVLGLPFFRSPFVVLSIIGLYLLFVLHYGPKWMEQRPPYSLKHIMRIYNAVQVVANVSLFIYGLKNSYLRKEFSLTCQPIDHQNTEPWMQKLLLATYGYYLTKYLDLLDTVFFVFRKKNHQITFLHVYHHAGMIVAVFIHMVFMAGSHSTLLGVINLFVHAVMYSYYFITSLRPIKEALWWKRHITQLQLLQFGYLMFHFFIAIINKTCHLPNFISMTGLIQNLFMFVLFYDFYRKAYASKDATKTSVMKIDEGSAESYGSVSNEKSE